MKCVKLGNTPNMEEDKVRKNHYKSIMNESGRQWKQIIWQDGLMVIPGNNRGTLLIPFPKYSLEINYSPAVIGISLCRTNPSLPPLCGMM